MRRTVYRPLAGVRLRHSYYQSGVSVGDLVAEPAPATQRRLAASSLGFRRLNDGFVIYGEVDPDASPERLLRPLGSEGLRLQVLLQPANPHLWSFSELPEYQPGQDLFYFNNLRDDQAEGRLHLGDSVADARVATPLGLLAGTTLSYPFASPVSTAELTFTDLFGNVVATRSFALPEPASEARVDLADVGLVPGRYTVSDDQGATLSFYYDPEIAGRRPFGVIEILSRTDGLTSDGSELVPADYRFLDGDELTGTDEYTLQLESRATRWRFHVVKKYANGFPLADLSITGSLSFTRQLSADRAVFTSDAAAALTESRQPLALEDTTDKVRDLPSPNAATPLTAGSTAGSFVSETYVYV